jgi:hypothetical protein
VTTVFGKRASEKNTTGQFLQLATVSLTDSIEYHLPRAYKGNARHIDK